MRRRTFLSLLAGAATSVGVVPALWGANTRSKDRILILVELAGGNDGLNTLVPFADPAYRKLRPKLALPRDKVLKLSSQAAMHPGLGGLMPSWEAGDLAWVQGLGYPAPNRSHFRSIDIWETASDSDQVLDQGWLNRGLGEELARGASHSLPSAIVLGEGDPGPLSGESLRSLVIQNPKKFLQQAKRLEAAEVNTSNPALRHVLAVQRDITAGAQTLEGRLNQVRKLPQRFGKGALARQLELAAKLVIAEVPVSVIKVTHKGFDTHAKQLPKHARLMKMLGDDLGALRHNLIKANRWSDVVVMTYSEFGRRAAENASGGTDHGTAAPHLVMGGRVKGGLLGTAPSLEIGRNKDIKHTMDFRRLYATVLSRWWGKSARPVLGNYAPLPLLPG